MVLEHILACQSIRKHTNSCKSALIYNNHVKKLKLDKRYPVIQDGEKLKFTYLKQPNPLKDMVISFPIRIPKEFEIQEFIDYETQFQKELIEPIRFILDCVTKIEKKYIGEDFFGESIMMLFLHHFILKKIYFMMNSE